MDRVAFFEKYAIDEENFEKLGLSWDELERIHEEYTSKLTMYEDTARYLADLLNKEKSIHSIKYRVKDKEHLIEKIIRKSFEDPAFRASYTNYEINVKDLIGLRALHLFKENWVDIHNFLAENWDFYTPPRANYKKGDPESLLGMYASMGCELNEHKNGYRSVHYHLLIRPGRQDMVAEVQVRTLFEEAWSEIDHYFRYGAKKDVEQAEPYIGVLNNITSNADALASYINNLDMLAKIGEESANNANNANSINNVNKVNGLNSSNGESRLNVREIYKRARYG